MDQESKREQLMRAAVLKALLNIRDNGAEDKQYGICLNVLTQLQSATHGTKNVYAFINDMAVGWPQHSGMKDYPIPSTNKKIRNAAAYYDTRYHSPKRLWQGRQRYLRNDLVKYMIKRLYRMISS